MANRRERRRAAREAARAARSMPGTPPPEIRQALGAAVHHMQAGRLAAAESLCRQILAVRPAEADALHLLGVIAHSRGEHRTATDLIGRAIAADATDPDYHNNIGEAYRAAGDLQAAAAAYGRALTLAPDQPGTLRNLGDACLAAGRVEQAVESYRKGLALRPGDVELHARLGSALLKRLDGPAAEAALRRALAGMPNRADLQAGLGEALALQGNAADAVAAYRAALERDPAFPPALVNLANLLREMGRLSEAEALSRRALDARPNLAAAHNALGVVLMDRGQPTAAVAEFDRATATDPTLAAAESNLCMALHYDPAATAATIGASHRRWDQRHGRPPAAAAGHRNDPDPERRLRIGYVSPDFRTHSVAFFFEPLLQAHDRGAVEIRCYGNQRRDDAVTERLRGLADGWRDIAAIDDHSAAELIRKDGIDILIDLAGHTAGNRLPLFARRPAPVQMTYLGYPDVTGLSAMDYRIADAVTDPAADGDADHGERVLRLDRSFLCYRMPPGRPAPVPPPATTGGAVTFGSFNYLAKINPDLIGEWAAILSGVPGSRIVLKSAPLADEETRRTVRAHFAGHGIAADRVDLMGRVESFDEHLGLYGRIDIALDTFPYHGTTTTCEALAMGVPVIVRTGGQHMSRVGASLLTAIGLEDLIAGSAAAYRDLAVALAGDAARLTELRQTLPARLEASALTDAAALARAIEAAYRGAWRQWCARTAGGPPAPGK